MDSPTELNAPSTGSFSQMPHEDVSADTQAVSKAPAKNEYELTLSYGLVYRRRRGVRTMASLKRDLKGLFPTWLRRRNEAIQNRKKNRNEPLLQCDCCDCLSNPGPSGIVKDYDVVLATLPEWIERLSTAD